MSSAITPELRTKLEGAFQSLNRRPAEKSFPAPYSLARTLESLVPAKGVAAVQVSQQVPTLFATAAVEMWLRAVHTFLISASLTDVSPIWCSVSGYYSSHYSVRAFAHLLGFFQLFRKK